MQTRGLALLAIDPQADFCDDGGAYARHGVNRDAVRKIIAPLGELMRACQARGVPIIASQFTIVCDRSGKPIVGEALLKARPFLAHEGFRIGNSGHAMASGLPAPDFLVEKPTFSAFYTSRLDFVLDRLGVKRLLIAGVGTNGAVESTVRDAQLRDLELTLITDCTAGFNAELHEASMKNLSTLAKPMTSRQVIDALASGGEN